MPLSELEKKVPEGMSFDCAAEEVRRLKGTPTEAERLELYGLYKQALHGDIPGPDIYPEPTDLSSFEWRKYNEWWRRRQTSRDEARKEYVRLARRMIELYGRRVERTKWNSQVWSVDY